MLENTFWAYVLSHDLYIISTILTCFNVAVVHSEYSCRNMEINQTSTAGRMKMYLCNYGSMIDSEVFFGTNAYGCVLASFLQ